MNAQTPKSLSRTDSELVAIAILENDWPNEDTVQVVSESNDELYQKWLDSRGGDL